MSELLANLGKTGSEEKYTKNLFGGLKQILIKQFTVSEMQARVLAIVIIGVGIALAMTFLYNIGYIIGKAVAHYKHSL